MSVIVNDFAAQSKQVTVNPMELLKVVWRGADSAAATGLYLQFWDCVSGPAEAAATLKFVRPLIGGATTAQGAIAEESFTPGDDECEFGLGIFAGVSSTEATYTAATGNNKYAMLSVEMRRPEQPNATSFVGDLTSAVTGLQVWSEATGASTKKRLCELEVDGTNLTGTRQWIMLFAKDTVNTGDVTEAGDTIPITPGASLGVLTGLKAKQFGVWGREMSVNDAGTYRYGCTVKISSTAPGYTAANGTACIRAKIRTAP